MVPLFQIVFSNIIVATLIAILAWQVGRSGRRAKAAHLLWILCFIKLVTPPIVLFPVSIPGDWLPQSTVFESYSNSFVAIPTTDLSQPALEDASTVTEVAASQSVASVPAAVERRFQIHWLHVVLAIWMIGFFTVLLRSLVRFVRFHRLLHREGKLDAESSEFVRQLIIGNASKSRTFSPSVLRLPIRVSPMLFGIGRGTVIVCPDQLWHSLDETKRHAFLAHEAGHFYRRDHWVRWLELFVTAVYWWFPGVYFAKQQLERHEEACCDAWAVKHLDAPPRSYCEALLQVVDFISENSVGIPGLASGMHPTETLEERLRLVMRPSDFADTITPIHLCAGAICSTMWLLHPIPAVQEITAETQTLMSIADATELTSVAPLPESVRRVPEIILPDVPTGFWNQSPKPQWADFELALPGAHLTANTSRGIQISVPGREDISFQDDELTSIAEIPDTQRVVIGNRSGQVRLWDLMAGTPVSLIGQHTTKISSMAFHSRYGLISADQDGSLMQWDIQSGQVLASWSTRIPSQSQSQKAPAIQSVRFSIDGTKIAVLSGRWSDTDSSHRIQFLDSRSFESIGQLTVSPSTAVVLETESDGWVCVEWSGAVRSLESGSIIKRIEKHLVSAIAFSPIASLPL